jgi:hypothetical protein
MRKPTKKLFRPANLLIALLVIVLSAGVFVACNNTTDYTPPDVVEGNNGNSVTTPDDTTGEAKLLTFAFTKEQSSIFHAIVIDDFDVSDINVFVTYRYNVSGITYYNRGQAIPLTEEMIAPECRPFLTQPGAHTVKVSYEVDGKTVSGSFMLYLREAFTDNRKLLTFNLDGGYPGFGNKTETTSTVKVVGGSTFSWQEFISAFPVYKDGKAITAWTYSGGRLEPSSSPLTISDDMTFTPVWSDDVVTVNFNLNTPEGAIPIDADNPPAAPAAQSVARNAGYISRPDFLQINNFYGYEFLGWYTADGELWNFNSRVGKTDITLTAEWAVCSYDVTFNFMGGALKDSQTEYPSAKLVTSAVRTEKSTGDDYAVVFYQIPYNALFSDYYSTVKVDGQQRKIYLSHVENFVGKGGDYYYIENWYTDNICSDDALFEIDGDSRVTDNLTLYAKWKQSDNIEDIDDYYVNYLYKGGLTLKGDGTLRIDKLYDASVNELTVPDFIRYEGKARYVTEIADYAYQNTQSLVKLDLSRAAHLTSIGQYAFANSVALREVVFPSAENNSISYVGANAFVGTYWRNNYYEETRNKFIVINSILYEYIYKDAEPTLSASDFPSQATSIAAGCFRNNDTIEEITLPATIKTIYGYAFQNAKSLRKINVAAGGSFDYIDGNAFAETDYFQGVGNDNVVNSAIVIGNVYFRYVGAKSNTSAVVPDGVTIIAPNAFADKTKIAQITFENDCDQDIVSIGQNAFNSTAWAKSEQTYPNSDTYVTSDGFVVINGILATYVQKAETVKLPRDIAAISAGAFASSNSSTKRILIETDVRYIESKAFSGLKGLESITFKSVSPNLAEIVADTFCDRDGVTLEGLTVYLSGEAWEMFEEASSGGLDAYPVWKAVFEAESDLFARYSVASVAVNTDKLPSYLLNESSNDFDVLAHLVANCGMVVQGSNGIIEDGLIVTTSDGYSEYEAWENVPNSPIIFVGTSGEHAITVQYSKDPSKSLTYTYTVISAIALAPIYDKNDVATVINGNSNSYGITVAGLKTQFFTSETKLNLNNAVIGFTRYDGTQGEFILTPDMIVGIGYTSALGNDKVLEFALNYHDLATYRIQWTYSVTEAKDVSVEQYNSLSLPLNSAASGKLSSAQVKIYKEDGSAYLKSLREVSIVSVDGVGASTLPTDVLGYHTVGFKYESKHETLTGTYVYSVVIEANSTHFKYEYNDADKTAVIIGTTTYPEIMVLPGVTEKIVDSEAVSYTVVAIADNAFKNNTVVKYVYIANTIKSIGAYAFSGCKALAGIYSFVQVDNVYAEIPLEDLEVLSETVTHSATLSLSGLKNATKLNALVIPYEITITETQANKTEIFNCSLLLSDGIFEGYNGYIYLPDTSYFRAYAEENLGGRGKLGFYVEGARSSSDSSYFEFENYDSPAVISSETVQTRVIKSGARISGYSDGVVIIPYSGTYTDGTNEVDYTITGFQAGAFDNIADVKTLFLPDTVFLASDLSGYEFTTVVYKQGVKDMIAPAEIFSSYIETIGKGAFEKCTALQSIDFSNAASLKTIEMYAFAGSGLTSADLSATALTEIDAHVFNGCLSLSQVVVPASIEAIGTAAFYDCRSLTSFTGYNAAKLSVIASQAFGNCALLRAFTVDGGYIAADAFDGCIK